MDIVLLLNYAIAFLSLFSVNVFIILYLKHRKDYHKIPEDDGWRPMVSVIMPAHNEGKYISKSIKSLLEMDYPKDKLELIVVDDGSTDDTYPLASSFESSSVHVFHKENKGKGSALNFGLAKAKGEIVATMDADSYLKKDTILKLIPHFNDPEVMAVTPAVKIKPSDSWIKELQRVEYLMILFSRKILNFIDSVPVTPGPFSMFRAVVFDKVGGFSENNLVEDQEIALRIQSHNYKIRSSVTADVYTEPPSNLSELLHQRVRWQRGGFRNFWHYRFMIKPEYGDFGIYFVPLNFISMTAFFLLLGLMLYSFISTPYYVQYIWVDALGMSITLVSLVGVFVVISSTIMLHLAIKSFEGERVKLRYLASFVIFYWYLMIGYNTLFLIKELRKESFSW